jgi:hypothetical protein
MSSAAHAEIVSTAIANDWLINEKTYPGSSGALATLRAGIGFSVDYGRLGIEWAIIAALYSGGVVALSSRRAAN